MGNSETITRITEIWKLLGGDDGVDKILAGDLVVRIEGAYLNRSSQQVELPACRGINTKDFYAQQGWLEMSGDKGSLGADTLQAEVDIASITLNYLDMNASRTESQILEHIQPQGVFEDPVIFFAYLSLMISAQRSFPSRQALVDNALANLFFVRIEGVVRTICVYEEAGYEKGPDRPHGLCWCIYFEDSDFGCAAGDRVFFPIKA